MAIKLPNSAKEVVSRSKADVQRELAESNPFLRNSWLGAIVTGCANRVFDFYIQLKAAIRENFPDTATGDYLIRWASIWGKQLQAATRSTGKVVVTGTAGSTLPIATVLVASGVGEYTTLAEGTVATSVISISSLTRSGTTVTVTTPSNHGLASGVEVTISGASNSEYNITSNIVVIAANQFQYEIAGTPVDEPSTSAKATFTGVAVSIQSVDFGASTNLDAGSELRLQSPAAGIDDTMYVDFNTIGGGTDIESEESLRERMLDRIQNPVAQFNVASIVEKAKEVPGVTRVFVQEVTPDIGQVTVYFMRDNDDNPIPSGSEVTTTKDKILTIKPANTSDVDVIVLAPTPVVVNFSFSALSPDTASMKEAVTANLQQFFDEKTNIAVNIDEDAYRSSIFNTVDPDTGDVVSTFTLSSPVGDITINSGEIGILGTVTFS